MKQFKRTEKNKRKRILLSAGMIILNLIILFMFKYFNNDLSLLEFKITHIGNLLNLFFGISTVFGLIILSASPAKASFPQAALILYLSAALIILFAGVYIVSGFIELNSTSIGIYSSKKVILVLLILMNQFVQFFIFSLCYTLLFRTSNHIYFKAAALSVIVFVILFLFAFLYTTLFFDGEDNVINDREVLGIILGAAVYHNNEPSPVFRGRIEKAYDLYQEGKVSRIQLTGGSAPGEITEAEAAFNYLRKLNVPPEDINIEKSTTNTTEQIKFVRKEIRNNSNLKDVIFISDHFHLQRVLEISDFFDVNAVGASSDTKYSLLTLLFYKFRESLGLLIFWFFAI